MNIQKECTQCRIRLPINEFCKHSGRKDGLSSNCRKCKSLNKKEYLSNVTNLRLHKDTMKIWKNNNPNYDTNYYHQNLKDDLNYKLSRAIRAGVSYSLNFDKNGKWTNLVNFNIFQLKQHLEVLFDKDMNWNNFGLGYEKWNIDHIIPLKYRNSDGTYYWNQEELKNSNSETFRKAWSLQNLQPKWWKENISKGNRYVG